MIIKLAIVLVLALLLFSLTVEPTAAHAGTFAGRYHLEGEAGTLVLTLESPSSSKVTGSVSGDGANFRIEGTVEGNQAAGAVVESGFDGLRFTAVLEGDRIEFSLIEVDSAGEPIGDFAEPLTFLRSGDLDPPAVNDPEATPAPLHSGRSRALEGWNLSYEAPPGWNVAKRFGHIDLLGSNAEAGGIFVGPGLYRDANDAIVALDIFFRNLEMTARPVEPPHGRDIGVYQTILATYDCQDSSGQPTRARVLCPLTQYGTGLLIVAMTAPEHFDRLSETAERVAASLQAGAPASDPQTEAALSGRWSYDEVSFTPDLANSGSAGAGSQETFSFDGAGSFRWYRSSYINTQAGEIYGATSTAAGTSEEEEDGVYRVIGRQLVLQGKRGTRLLPFDLQGDQLIVDGRIYRR